MSRKGRLGRRPFLLPATRNDSPLKGKPETGMLPADILTPANLRSPYAAPFEHRTFPATLHPVTNLTKNNELRTRNN